jgi:hypothetical protein
MVDSRHLAGSNPDVQIADEETNPELPTTVHFDARPPRAATHVQPETRSVVIRELGGAPTPYDPADVTQTIRPRAGTLPRPGKVIAWVERHWVSLAIGVSVPVTLLLGFSLLR